MRKRKVKGMLATLVAVLVLSGVFYASAAEGTGTGTNLGETTTTTTPSPGVDPTEPETPAENIGNVDSENLVEEIGKKEEGTTVGISYTGEKSELKAEVFDAIKGKDKTIELTDGTVTWSFNGNDIKGATNKINLKVEPSKLNDFNGSKKDTIKGLVKKASETAVLTFANNGTLPGKATISVKKDTLFPTSTKTTFYVYYFNEKTNKLVFVDTARVNGDNLTFDITHNSNFVITDARVDSSTTTTTVNRGSYKGPIDEHIVGGTSSSVKDNPHTGAY